MLHHDHAGEQTQDKKRKKRGPARAYQFGNTIIVEDEDGEVIKKYEIPPDRSKHSEKPAVSEKIRHRLARMGSYLGISYGETKAGSNERDVSSESSDGSITTKPQDQQPQTVTVHKQHPHGINDTQKDDANPSTSRQVAIEEIDRNVLEVDDLKNIFSDHYSNVNSIPNVKKLQRSLDNRPKRDRLREKEIGEGLKSDVFHSRFTNNAGARSMGKAVVKQIQQLDPIAHVKYVEDSDDGLVSDLRSFREPFPSPSLPSLPSLPSTPLLPPLPSWPSAASSSSAKEENHNHLQQQPKDHVRDLYEEESHSERDPRIFDEDDILDTRYIPWNFFPDISRLRVFRKNHLDRGDGERFTADEFDHVENLLFHVCRDLSYSRSLTDHQKRQITHLGGMGRICLILDLIEQRQLLRDFIRLKIVDDSLPLLLPILQDMLDPHEDGGRAAERFFAEQFRAVSRDWSNGAHHVMHRREALPFRPLRSIGFGSQGSIDEIQLPDTKETWARKKWVAGANLQKITARFDDEVKIIKKVAAHPHILELLASYTRGREFGLLLPVADCDLWHILTMNRPEREDVVSNQSLIQSWGCLSSGLLFMHDRGIKHKDIKPQNIVLRRGNFQFTDFGLSKDISDLSHSATDSADRGTFRYMAPEVTEYQPQGRAADVFSLACVLFEIFSVWRGFSVDDANSFSALAPFHKNLSAIHSWIGEFAPMTPLSVLRYKNSQSIFVSMFTQNSADRPHVRDVVFKMTMISYPRDLFCNRCLDMALRRPEVPGFNSMLPKLRLVLAPPLS